MQNQNENRKGLDGSFKAKVFTFEQRNHSHCRYLSMTEFKSENIYMLINHKYSQMNVIYIMFDAFLYSTIKLVSIYPVNIKYFILQNTIK